MMIDIENINSFENRNKVYIKLWSTIYKVIQQAFLIKLTYSRMIL